MEQLSLCATTTKACMPRACAPQQEKTLWWKACTLQLESSPHSLQLDKAQVQKRRPSLTKRKKKKRTCRPCPTNFPGDSCARWILKSTTLREPGRATLGECRAAGQHWQPTGSQWLWTSREACQSSSASFSCQRHRLSRRWRTGFTRVMVSPSKYKKGQGVDNWVADTI